MTGALRFMSIIVLAFLMMTAPVLAADKVLFDNGHGERFQVKEQGPLQLSGLAEVFQGAGFEVGTVDQPLSDATLAGARALIISGAFTPLHPNEIEAVARFIQNGGRVAVMLHIAPPMATLLNRLQVSHTMGVVQERENLLDGDLINFRVVRFKEHPLFAGVKDFSVHGAWGLINQTDAAQVIAATGFQAWIDVDQDQKQSKEETASFGVVVAGTMGKGSFLVFGDDAIFQNKFLEGNNKMLAANLAAWLK
ncbi:GldG family protein [Geomonas oryzisoli]|uniref:GldG family protein n=2 Tax=Geomonas oryzisoli TaxID=2847992 RepID=A0ABX8J7G2_9BACT|nr:GldG family protein [Geomonas oryzisoli]